MGLSVFHLVEKHFIEITGKKTLQYACQREIR